LATGHYARVTHDTATGAYSLRRAVDRRKDQSYFLWGMGQAELASSLFPLGALTKDAVRTVAAELGLRTAGKPESQEICFVTDGDYRRFLSEHGAKTSPNWRPVQSGPILDPEGRQVGIHRGVPFYTVGQRRGLGVALGVPMYVTRIDAERNAVWVGPAEALAARSFSVGDVRWASGTPPDVPLRTTVQVRHRHPGAPVEVVPLESGAVHVRAERPERGVTPGQSAVFYAEDRVLGGGIIEAVKA
jgi:tRNA-specific 2-thiouridylase